METSPGPVQLVAALEGLGGAHPGQLVLVLEEEPWLPGRQRPGHYHELFWSQTLLVVSHGGHLGCDHPDFRDDTRRSFLLR